MTNTPLTNVPCDDEQFEAVYVQYFELLVGLSMYKFRVPDADAEGLAHDVLMSYLKKRADVLELRSWLIGAICHASRHYWRQQGRTWGADTDSDLDRPDPASVRILDSLPAQLAAREALDCLSPRYRMILHMRYFEGCTVREVAARLGVKTKYAQKLITKCLRRAEQLYNERGKEKAAPKTPKTATPKTARTAKTPKKGQV